MARRWLRLIVSIVALAHMVPLVSAQENTSIGGAPVAATPAAPALEPGATTIYRYGFEPEPNEEPDEWPPGWTRRRGPGFPGYLPISIQSESRSEGLFALRMQLDGGAAAMFSPPMPCSVLADYLFQGALRVEPLTHDRAFFSLSFIDEQKRILAQFTSEPRQQTDGWRKLRIGPCRAPSEQAKFVVVGLHVEPTADRHDITGRVEFDDLWLAQVPRVSIEMNDRLRLYAPEQEIVIRCRTMGDGARPQQATLTVLDAFGKRVDSPLVKLADETPVPLSKPKEQRSGPVMPITVVGPTWKTRFSRPGYYRLLVELTYADNQTQRGETAIAVLSPIGMPMRGEYGWTLTHGMNDLLPDDLVRLLRESGSSWVKLPIWVGEDRAKVERLVTLSKDLRSAGVDMVGVLAEPPDEVRQRLHLDRNDTAARFVRAPLNDWMPSLDLLLTRLSWQVRAWQVGHDRDVSLPAVTNLTGQIAGLKKHLDAVGDDVTLGVAWAWKQPDPASQAATNKNSEADAEPQLPWRFAVVSDAGFGAPEELSAALNDLKQVTIPRWVSLEPTARDGGDSAARIGDLVDRMSIAKQHGVSSIFLNTPIRPRGGVYTPDGTPGELFLPWRTTCRALSGAKYLGELTLPAGTRNRVFVRDSQVIVVLAAREPAQEELYLGRNVQQIDVWGQSTALPLESNRQNVATGPLPTFIVGADEAVTRFRLALQLDHPDLPSQFGVRHKTGMTLRNTFSAPVQGVLRIVAPVGWRVSPDRHELRLNVGQTAHLPFDWHIPLNGTTGKQQVRFEFDLTADRRVEFSAFAPIEIGQGDLQLFLTSRLTPSGELVIDQSVRNDSDDPLLLKCHLYVPAQRRIRAQVFTPARGESQYTYTIPDGRALIGQVMWVRAEEVNGQRVLSQKFTAQE